MYPDGHTAPADPATLLQLLGELREGFSLDYLVALVEAAFASRGPAPSELQTLLRMLRGKKAPEGGVSGWFKPFLKAVEAMEKRVDALVDERTTQGDPPPGGRAPPHAQLCQHGAGWRRDGHHRAR